MAQPPRSLDQLLSSIPLEKKTDDLLASNVWLKQFFDYLQRHQNKEDILALKFLIAHTKLKKFHMDYQKASKAKQKEALLQNCTILLQQIKKDFFDIFENDVLAIANSKLQSACLEMDVDSFNEENMDLLKKVKEDPKVWHEGVESSYNQFLPTARSSMMACLLSIL